MLKYIKNNKGPSTDPCGIPYLTSDSWEQALFNFTYCIRLERYDDNQSCGNRRISQLYRLILNKLPI